MHRSALGEDVLHLQQNWSCRNAMLHIMTHCYGVRVVYWKTLRRLIVKYMRGYPDLGQMMTYENSCNDWTCTRIRHIAKGRENAGLDTIRTPSLAVRISMKQATDLYTVDEKRNTWRLFNTTLDWPKSSKLTKTQREHKEAGRLHISWSILSNLLSLQRFAYRAKPNWVRVKLTVRQRIRTKFGIICGLEELDLWRLRGGC